MAFQVGTRSAPENPASLPSSSRHLTACPWPGLGCGLAARSNDLEGKVLDSLSSPCRHKFLHASAHRGNERMTAQYTPIYKASHPVQCSSAAESALLHPDSSTAIVCFERLCGHKLQNLSTQCSHGKPHPGSTSTHFRACRHLFGRLEPTKT